MIEQKVILETKVSHIGRAIYNEKIAMSDSNKTTLRDELYMSPDELLHIRKLR